ncbi:MAG: LLM class flavin-dependent oxidoreductase [Proteobacteria bacterium]|nr:LLM class flavin-dependent oxidoreductase [Pseudomonadota bacterium]
MQIGLHLHAFNSTTGIMPGTFSGVLDLCQWAEQVGFSFVSVQDHLVAYPNTASRTTPLPDVWSTLSAIAALTRRIRLLPLVVNTATTHAVKLAQRAATLDLISDGRALLGLGIGGYLPDHLALGAVPGNIDDRSLRLGETVGVLNALWPGESVSYHGEYFSFDDHILAPAPTHPLQILIAGYSRSVRAVVAEHADFSNFSMVDVQRFRSLVARTDVQRRASDKHANAIRHTLLERIIVRETDREAEAAWQAKGAHGHRGVCGAPDTVIAALAGLEDAGASVVFAIFPDPISRSLFARWVLPTLLAF